MPLLTPHVPNGLIELMKDLAKEVLRDKPENIYEFAAVHFEKLIQQRDGSMDKGYEQFVAYDAHFDGQQRFAIPANCGYTCQRPAKPTLSTRKSKSDVLASFKAMESINEEDVPAESLYTDEKYQKAIYVIQRYYRRWADKKKEIPLSTVLTATTAAIIIQRTMRKLFANKIKLKTPSERDTGKHDGVVPDDANNESEAASYTSASTIQILPDSQEGKENRSPGRDEVSDGIAGDDGSAEVKEQTHVEPLVAEEENSEVTPTRKEQKSIADENGTTVSLPDEEKPLVHHPTTALDDTSTAHIGILSTIIGSNDQQNSLHTNTVEIDSNSSDSTHLQKSIPDIVAVGEYPLNFPKSHGATPDTLPAASPQSEIEESFAVRLQDNTYAENTTHPYQSDVQVRKYVPVTRESLRIYDAFYQDRDEPDFSDSLNESTMERDSLENEDLDVDSLESNENVTQNAKREVKQDDGSLYEDADDVQPEEEEEEKDVQRLMELERVPSYLYGIHPPRTPVVERKNSRNKSSADSRKIRGAKDLDGTSISGIEDRSPAENSEEVSLESKESTSDESSVTQIENPLEHSDEHIETDDDGLKDHEEASRNLQREASSVSEKSLSTIRTGTDSNKDEIQTPHNEPETESHRQKRSLNEGMGQPFSENEKPSEISETTGTSSTTIEDQLNKTDVQDYLHTDKTSESRTDLKKPTTDSKHVSKAGDGVPPTSSSHPMESYDTEESNSLLIESLFPHQSSPLGYFATLYSDHNLSPPTSASSGEYDPEVKAHIREIQGLNYLYPGLEIKDIISEFHSKDVQPTGRNAKNQVHDANNNLEGFERNSDEDSASESHEVLTDKEQASSRESDKKLESKDKNGNDEGVKHLKHVKHEHPGLDTVSKIEKFEDEATSSAKDEIKAVASTHDLDENTKDVREKDPETSKSSAEELIPSPSSSAVTEEAVKGEDDTSGLAFPLAPGSLDITINEFPRNVQDIESSQKTMKSPRSKDRVEDDITAEKAQKDFVDHKASEEPDTLAISKESTEGNTKTNELKDFEDRKSSEQTAKLVEDEGSVKGDLIAAVPSLTPRALDQSSSENLIEHDIKASVPADEMVRKVEDLGPSEKMMGSPRGKEEVDEITDKEAPPALDFTVKEVPEDVKDHESHKEVPGDVDSVKDEKHPLVSSVAPVPLNVSITGVTRHVEDLEAVAKDDEVHQLSEDARKSVLLQSEEVINSSSTSKHPSMTIRTDLKRSVSNSDSTADEIINLKQEDVQKEEEVIEPKTLKESSTSALKSEKVDSKLENDDFFGNPIDKSEPNGSTAIKIIKIEGLERSRSISRLDSGEKLPKVEEETNETENIVKSNLEQVSAKLAEINDSELKLEEENRKSPEQVDTEEELRKIELDATLRDIRGSSENRAADDAESHKAEDNDDIVAAKAMTGIEEDKEHLDVPDGTLSSTTSKVNEEATLTDDLTSYKNSTEDIPKVVEQSSLPDAIKSYKNYVDEHAHDIEESSLTNALKSYKNSAEDLAKVAEETSLTDALRSYKNYVEEHAHDVEESSLIVALQSYKNSAEDLTKVAEESSLTDALQSDKTGADLQRRSDVTSESLDNDDGKSNVNSNEEAAVTDDLVSTSHDDSSSVEVKNKSTFDGNDLKESEIVIKVPQLKEKEVSSKAIQPSPGSANTKVREQESSAVNVESMDQSDSKNTDLSLPKELEVTVKDTKLEKQDLGEESTSKPSSPSVDGSANKEKLEVSMNTPSPEIDHSNELKDLRESLKELATTIDSENLRTLEKEKDGNIEHLKEDESTNLLANSSLTNNSLKRETETNLQSSEQGIPHEPIGTPKLKEKTLNKATESQIIDKSVLEVQIADMLSTPEQMRGKAPVSDHDHIEDGHASPSPKTSDIPETKVTERSLNKEKPGLETEDTATNIERETIDLQEDVPEKSTIEMSASKRKTKSEPVESDKTEVKASGPSELEQPSDAFETRLSKADVDQPESEKSNNTQPTSKKEIEDKPVKSQTLETSADPNDKKDADLGVTALGDKAESSIDLKLKPDLEDSKAKHLEEDSPSVETAALADQIQEGEIVKAKSFVQNAALNEKNLSSELDNHKTQPNDADHVDPTASSSVSMPTEVTSCDDSNAETSADFSSIGKDLDFFEDTITYLKSATTLLGRMDDVFDGTNKKDAPHPTVIVHLAEDAPIENEEPKSKQDMKSNIEHQRDEKNDRQIEEQKENKDILSQAAIIIQSAIRGYRVRKALKGDTKDPVEDTIVKREKRSLVSEAPGAGDILRQAAVVIQSAIRGYRVRKALNDKIKKSEANGNEKTTTMTAEDAKVIAIEEPKGGLGTKTEKTSSPVAIIHPTRHLPHPTVVVHLAEDLLDDDEADQTDEPKLDLELKDGHPLERGQSDNNSDMQRKDQTGDEVPTDTHIKRSSTLPTSITRERHIETRQKHGIASHEIGTMINREEPVQRKVNIVKSMSLDDTRQAKTFTKRERKPKTVKNDNLKGSQTSLVREKPIEIRGKAVKPESFDKIQKGSAVRKTQDYTEKNGSKSKALHSKPPSTSDLLKGARLAKNKRNQFGKKGRSMSMNEQIPETSFDVEAIKKELLSKKGKSPPQSGRKTKVSAKENRSFRTQPSVGKDSKTLSHSDSRKEVSDHNKPSKTDNNSTDLTDEKSDAVKEYRIDSSPYSDKLDSSKSVKINAEPNLGSDEDSKAASDNSKEKRDSKIKSKKSESSESKETKNTPTDSSHVDDKTERPSDTAEENLGENDIEKVEEAVLQKSATTIQKTFRGYKVRKNIASEGVDTSKVPEQYQNTVISVPQVTDDALDATTTSQKKDELQEVKVPTVEKGETSGIFDNLRREVDDFKHAVLEKSATKIQKTFRGYKTRKDLAVKDKRANTVEETEKSHLSGRGEKLNIEEDKVGQQPGVFDSFDVEEFHNAALEKSATTIQKTFRGYKTRKDLQDGKLQREHRQDDGTENREIKNQAISEEDMPVNEVLEEAAVTIQKTYKGFKTRKDLQGDDRLQQNSSKMRTQSGDDVVPKPGQESNNSLILTGHETSETHDNNQNELDNSLNSSKSDLDDLTEETLRDAKSLSPDRQEPLAEKNKADIVNTSIKATSASALLENAAATIQKAYRTYHTRKDATSTQSPPIKSYSHGAKRENTFKETFENSDESSTFIGPDTSFDLSDVESEKHVPNSTDPPTLLHDEEKFDELDLDIPTTLAITFHSEDLEHPNDSANTMASTGGNSLFVPQERRRKRSIIDPTAPLLEDILHANDTTNNDQKPQWYVGDVLITPTDNTNIPTDPSSFLKPLASSSSLSSFDARNENLNSNQQLTPSINSAVVSTSSLLFTNDTEMHDIDPLNKHSRAVSANEEEKEEIDRLDENKSDVVDRIEEIADNQDHEKDEDLSNGSPRREDGPESIVADMCKNCADGIHDTDGHTCQEAELSKETSSEVANVEDTKDGSDSTEKHFDEIKQFVLMEESSPAKHDSQNGEIEEINKTNGNKSVDDTEKSPVDIQLSNVQNGDDKGEPLVVGVDAIDNDSRECPSIALIPPSSEDDLSDRDSIHETKTDENDLTTSIESSDKVLTDENDNKATEKLEESPSIDENSINTKKTDNNEEDAKRVSVDALEDSTTVKGDEIEKDPSVNDPENSNTIESLNDAATEDAVTEVKAEVITPSQDVSESSSTVKVEVRVENEGKDSEIVLSDIHAEEEAIKKPDLELLSASQASSKSILDEKFAETDAEVSQSSKMEHDALKKETEKDPVVEPQRFEDNFIKNADSKAADEGSISVIKESQLSSEKSLEKITAHSQSSNDKPLANGDSSVKNGNIQSAELKSTHDSKDNEKVVPSTEDLSTEKLSEDEKSNEDETPNEGQKPSEDDKPNKEEKSNGDETPNEEKTRKEDEKLSKEKKSNEDETPNEENTRREDEIRSKEKQSNEVVTPNEDKKPSEHDKTNKEEKSNEDVTPNEDEKPNKNEKSDEKPIEGDSEPKAVDGTPKSEDQTEKQTSLEDNVTLTNPPKNTEIDETLKDVVSKTLNSETQEDDKPPEEGYKKDLPDTEVKLTRTADPDPENLEGIPLKNSSFVNEGSAENTTSFEKDRIKSSSKSTEEVLPPETEQMTIAEGLDDAQPKVESSAPDDSTKDAAVPQTQKEILQEDLKIASKLLENSLLEVTPVSNDTKSGPGELNLTTVSDSSPDSSKSKTSTDEEEEKESDTDLEIQANVEKLIEDSLLPVKSDAIDRQDLPTENATEEVIEVTFIKKTIPPTPLSATSDQDESELESTTTKADSTTTPGYDDASENDDLEIPSPMPDNLESVTEKLRETEAMVARMHQRRASEHRISIDTVDQPPVFDEPIKPMRELQKSTSTEVEDDIILQKLQRSDTTRESSAQSESVIFGDSAAQMTESDDTFNENLDLKSLHRMNTVASERSTFKPPGVLFKSVTIDDTVKYIDPEKSTEESGGSFCMDDAMTADVRKKIMAYSVSEADSDYYEPGDHPTRPHDDFNISTALDTFPSSDTDTTIISAATKIQAGARGFLARRRLRRASMGTKSSLTEETKASFGNEAIGESLDRLVEEEDGKRMPKVQYHRQVGVNSLPSAMGNSDGDELHPEDDSDDLKLARLTATTITTQPHGEWSSIDGQGETHNLSTSSETDVNRGIEEGDDSTQVPSILEATLAARRLTLQRGDAMRNDSAPDDDNNGNAKQVDPAKNIPATTDSMLIHQKTMVESTKTTTTTTTTTTERRNYSDAATTIKMEKVKWFAMRQNSMPVQIDSEVFRVLPKHMRKRIKSAEGEQKKRIRLPRD